MESYSLGSQMGYEMELKPKVKKTKKVPKPKGDTGPDPEDL